MTLFDDMYGGTPEILIPPVIETPPPIEIIEPPVQGDEG